MVVVTGRFDGKKVVLDEPAPKGAGPDTPVRVIFESEPEDAQGVLRQIADMAKAGGLPKDFARQHEHYVKGTPRR